MLFTDPSYNNRTIASTLKMQIRTVQRLREQLNTSDDPLEVVERKPKAGDIMSPLIFEVGWKVYTKVYMDVLKSVVIPWCNQVAGGRPWLWQQDSAPAHKSKQTHAWLQKECYNFLPFSHWPSPPPDLNLLDYLVSSYVENITNMTSHNTKASLIAAIRRVFAELPPAFMEKACF